MITALAGGVGAARFLAGLTAVVEPSDVTAIVNVGDDDTFYGLHVSPDLDSVMYTLGNVANSETGWGRRDESFRVLESLGRFDVPTWFGLGDQDLATHLVRSDALGRGMSLSEVTRSLTRAFGVETRLIPATDNPLRTIITARPADGSGRDYAMQEWFVRERAQPEVERVRFAGADEARPAPGVLEAIGSADVIVVCPSNPVISIAPILAVPGILDALAARREHVVAVTPIVAGAPLRGPADRLMRGLGIDVSCVGVAKEYAPWCATLVIDARDADRAVDVEALGVRAVVTDTVMRDQSVASELARTTLAASPHKPA